MRARPVARVALAMVIVALGALAPAFAVSAAETNEIVAAADGWVNSYRPNKTHGSERRLKTYGAAYETYIRFDTAAWRGKRIDSLRLRLSGVTGDSSTLLVDAAAPSWEERTLNFKSRPQVLDTEAPPAATDEGSDAGSATFDVSSLVGATRIGADSIAFRVTATSAALVGFSSREGTSPPTLELTSPAPSNRPPLPVAADTYASALTPDATYAGAQVLVVDAEPATEAFIKFDLSDWVDQRVGTIKLGLWLKDDAGPGAAVHRIANTWHDSDLAWGTRPDGGTLLATVVGRMASGPVVIDLGEVFPGGWVDRQSLSLRLTTAHANGFVAWSSEGPMPPFLIVRAGTGDPPPSPTPTNSPAPTNSATPTSSPTPTPTKTPSPTPTPTGTPSPTPKPTPTPTPPPTPTPSPTPSPTPTPTQTPTPTDNADRWVLRGFGTDHGVGMSQHGARGRANAGQTYDQILAHYYTDTTLGQIGREQYVRVLLAASRQPTEAIPTRITARGGGWRSDVFSHSGTSTVFPADSFAQMERTADGWGVVVRDSGGAVLASALSSDITMTGADATTLFEMKFRDSLPKYDLYRGQMRMLIQNDGVTAVNTVEMDDYLKGVVPAEVPPLWPIEAVKAQAVTARGYAYVRLKPTNVYDVRPTADNQVYGGVRLEHPRSNLAVDATTRQVVMYNGEPANTYFFTVGGGHTENNELAWVNNVGKVVSNPIPYLRGVPDVDENGLAYDRFAPDYDWQSDSFTWAELEWMLARDPRTVVGTLLDLRFERGVSDRIYRVTVVGSARTVVISGQALKGIYNLHRLSGARLVSSMFYLERAP